MEIPLVVGNWKSHFTVAEATGWLNRYAELATGRSFPKFPKPVVCAPFTGLFALAQLINERRLPLNLGAQDLSAFGEGSYTGEVAGRLLTGLAKYVLVGHSERRRLCGESTLIVAAKVTEALKAGLIPIICAANLKEVPVEARNNPKVIIMFEPETAISQAGHYRAESPQAVKKVLANWRKRVHPKMKFFYGGSVNETNTRGLILQSRVAGLVVGHASLSPDSFVSIINQARAAVNPHVLD